MATALKEKMVRISTSPLKEDDFTFTLDGVRYYMDKAVGEDREMLATRALRELEMERDKIATLEQELIKFKLKAAEYEGFLKGIAFAV